MSARLFDLSPSDVAVTTDDWYTPHWVFSAAGLTFDMDVAAPVAEEYRTVPARRYLTVLDDGLTTAWQGLIWCNPPYSKAEPWVNKWAKHPEGLLLTRPMPEVHWCGTMLGACDALAFVTCDFLRPGGGVARLRWLNVLVARGERCVEAVKRVAAADKYAAGSYLLGAS
jgi:hypothetical protein